MTETWREAWKRYSDANYGDRARLMMDSFAAGYPAAQAQQAAVDKVLRNLMAVMHRDGGHYVAEHGLLKAIVDAEALWEHPAAELERLRVIETRARRYAEVQRSSWRSGGQSYSAEDCDTYLGELEEVLAEPASGAVAPDPLSQALARVQIKDRDLQLALERAGVLRAELERARRIEQAAPRLARAVSRQRDCTPS